MVLQSNKYFHYLCSGNSNIMGYKIIADSLVSNSIGKDSLMVVSPIESVSPFLSGDVPYQVLEYADQGNQFFITNQPIWYFILLFILIVGIAVSQVFFGQLLRGSFQAAVRYSITVGLYNDNSQVQMQKDNILFAVYFVSLAFFVFLLEIRFSLFPFKIIGFPLFLLNIVFLAALFYFKNLLVKFVAFVFNQSRLYSEYLYHSFTLNKLFGLLLVPLIFLLSFSRESFHEVCFYASSTLSGAMIAMKIIKGIIFSLKKRVFSFYLFLYLCALEIVPILLVYKLITSIV